MNRPLVQLILSRIREFYREPAAIFWVYGFPLILALGLGLAFPNRPVESIRMDVVAATSGDREAAEQLAARWSERDPRLKIEISDEVTARNRLRTAKTALILIPDPAAPAKFRYVIDENQPGSVLARAAVDNLVLRSQDEKAKVPEAEQMVNESGGRYIDFLMPGLIGTNLMGGGLFGVGFLIVDMRVRKLLKRFLATPMRKTDFMLALMASRLLFTIIEIIVLLTAAYFFFGVTVHGNLMALANATKHGERAGHIRDLMKCLRAATVLLRVSHDAKYVSHGLWAESVKLLDSIGKQGGGWLKSAALNRAPAA